MRRDWIKLHIACDVERHLITSVEVTDEMMHDKREFRALLDGGRDSVGRVCKVYGDAAYDSRKNFNRVVSVGAGPVIRPRKNASRRAMGSYARVVREFMGDPDRWRKRHGQQVEAVFSSLMRMLGEYVSSVIGMVNDVLTKAFVYSPVEAHNG